MFNVIQNKQIIDSLSNSTNNAIKEINDKVDKINDISLETIKELEEKVDNNKLLTDASIQQLDNKIDNTKTELDSNIQQLDNKVNNNKSLTDASIQQLDNKIDNNKLIIDNNMQQLNNKIDNTKTVLDNNIQQLEANKADTTHTHTILNNDLQVNDLYLNSSSPMIKFNAGNTNNDFARIMWNGTDNTGTLEIATANDAWESICASQYRSAPGNIFAELVRQAKLLNYDGNSSFPGTVTARNFNTTEPLNINAINNQAQITFGPGSNSQDRARIRFYEQDNIGNLEIATAKDSNEQITVCQYIQAGAVPFAQTRGKAVLLDTNGNTSFSGVVSAKNFQTISTIGGDKLYSYLNYSLGTYDNGWCYKIAQKTDSFLITELIINIGQPWLDYKKSFKICLIFKQSKIPEIYQNLSLVNNDSWNTHIYKDIDNDCLYMLVNGKYGAGPESYPGNIVIHGVTTCLIERYTPSDNVEKIDFTNKI